MAETIEAGYSGQIVSLGGFVDKTERGRQVIERSVATNSGVYIQVMGSNLRRKWALFQNFSDVNISIYFHQTGHNPVATLKPLGSFQIDDLISWTGPVWAQQSSGNNKILFAFECVVGDPLQL